VICVFMMRIKISLFLSPFTQSFRAKMPQISQKSSKVCVYFARGNCNAKECKFRHDLENILCKRNCKQKSCKFKHFSEILEPFNKLEKLKLPPRAIFLQNEPVLVSKPRSVATNVPNTVQNTTTAILDPEAKENDRFAQLYDLSCRDLLPYHLPIPSLKTSLKLHQLQGLTWLIEKEAQLHGGILADGISRRLTAIEMGLGKTFLMIALVNVSNKGMNLIVCPVSLIKPWISEIKLRSDNSVIEYVSKLTNDTLKQYRFIIISYEMLSSTYSKRPSFYDLEFERVILDEADKIRNHKTKMAISCYSLNSVYRWAVTGTPINNSVLDLYSLVRFLRIKPMMDLEYFKKHLGMDSSHKLVNLQALVRKILLRRTKDLVIDLPPITFEKRELEMTGFERMVYDLVVTRADTVRVLRLKQCCNDVYSIDGVFEEGEIDSLWKAYCLKDQNDGISHLFDGLKIGKNDEEDFLKGFANLKLQESTTLSTQAQKSLYTSTKIKELLKICQEKSSLGEKTIIFSQFVRMLYRLSTILKSSNLSCTLFTGDMSKQSRSLALNTFTKSSSILLASLKCASVGLNLTIATTVIMFDQWYNPASEDQAFARVYRIGQTKPVQVIRLVMKNTVEKMVLEINEDKRKGIRLVVGDDGDIEGLVDEYGSGLMTKTS
jgi:SNF2 family DNA or RNA helicase